MRRRYFLGLDGARGLSVSPCVGLAQRAVPARIGFLGGTSSSIGQTLLSCFLLGMRKFGWVEGRDFNLEIRWTEIQRQTRAIAPQKVAVFFSDLLDAVVVRKLHESNIRLAVVDEVHNWKGNANGSGQFRASFANAVPHKLLMTATPLQMGAEEMDRIFSYAATAGGTTAVVLDHIRGAKGLVSNCLHANYEFVKAL